MNTIAGRLRNNQDMFDEADSVVSNPNVSRQIKAGSMLAETRKKCAFFYEKDSIGLALEILNRKYYKSGIHFLIIAPETKIEDCWMGEQHKHFAHMRLLPILKEYSSPKKRRIYNRWNRIKVNLYDKQPHLRLLCAVYGSCNEYSPSMKIVSKKLIEMAEHYIINPEYFVRNPDYYINCFNIGGKMDKNEAKYPVEKAKGVATKYNKL